MKHDKKKKRKRDRQSDEEEEPEQKVCKTTISAVELREAFKGQTPIKLLKEFMQSEKKGEQIGEYIKAGGSVSELLVLLNDFDLKKNVSPAIPVFQSLKLFIVKCLSDFPSLKKKLVEECRQLLSIHLNTLISMLSSSQTPRDKKTSLELLTVLISCHETLAWEVLSKCSLPSQDLQSLAFKKKHTDSTSVRDSYIPFLISFLVDQPPNIVLKFLHVKGFLTSVFPGLINDKFHLILITLETLRTKIVENKNVSKSLKLNIFNTTSMCNLLSVYNWDPTFGATELGRVNEEDKNTVKNYLHNLMVPLLTSEKQGVIFVDKSFGSTGKTKNELVVNMFKQAGPCWRDPMTEDLFIKTISASPDLAKPFYKHIEQFITSSTPEKWCSIIKFLSSLIGTVDLNIMALENKPTNKIFYQLYFPDFFIVSVVSKIKEGTHEEMLCGTRCLSVCLSQLKNKCPSDVSIAKHLMFILNNTAEFIISNIEKWSIDFEIDGLLNSLDCLLNCFYLCPQLLDSIRFTLKSKDIILTCINKIKEVESSQERDVKRNLSCLKSIQLCEIIWPLEHTSEDFAFWLEDLAYFMINDPEVLSVGLRIFKSTLMETSLFEGSYEVNLWLQALSVKCSRDIGNLLSTSFRYAEANLRDIYGELREALAEAPVDDSPPQIMDLVTYLKAALLTYNDEAPADLDITFTPSPLLIALLKIIASTDSYDGCRKFVQELLMQICHHCSSPSLFLILLRPYAHHKFVAPIINYIESWLNGTPISAQCVSSPFRRLSDLLLSDEDIDISNELDSRLTASLLASQCFFYLTCGGISPKRISFAISNIVTKYPDLAPTLLSRPVLIQKFFPLSDPNSPSISNFVVLALCETEVPLLPLQQFSQKLSFLIRCAVTKKSSLRKAVGVGKTLKLLSLPRSEVQNIIDNCVPLPKKCLKGVSQWFEIVSFALEASVIYKMEVPRYAFISLLDQFVENLNQEMDYKCVSSSLGKFMALTHQQMAWDVKHVPHFNHILDNLLCNSIKWCPELAIEVYKHVSAFDMGAIGLERPFKLLASHKHSRHFKSINLILSVNYKEIVQKILSEPMPEWFGDLMKIMKDPGISSKALSKLCLYFEKNLNSISLCVNNLELISTACFTGKKPDVLFNILHNYLLLLKNYENVELLQLVGESLGHVLKLSNKKLEADVCRTCIMIGLRVPQLLNSFTMAVQFKNILMEPSEVFALTTSHSLFLEALIDNKFNSKETLVRLLHACVEEDKSIMKDSHIPVYLSSYRASLSREDQALMQLMKTYEENDIRFNEWKPIVWGQLAVQKYSIREVKKRVDITLCPTIDLLDLAMVNRTITKFPIDRSATDSNFKTYDSGHDIYDPVFILAVLSQVVGPGSDVPPRKVVTSGALGLALAALNSNCRIIRAMGYHLIHRFYQTLSDRKFDYVFMSFVETLQRTVVNHEECLRLNGVLCVFLARASLIMTEPPHPIYHSINNFIMAVDSFRLDTVPAFLELFHSILPTRAASVQFILEVIRDGIRTPGDLPVLINAATLKIILVYYDSSISNSTTRCLIEEILATALKKADYKQSFLTKEYSIMPWLSFNKKLNIAFENIHNIKKFYSR